MMRLLIKHFWLLCVDDEDTFLTQLMLLVEGDSKDLLAVNVKRVVEWGLFCGWQKAIIVNDIW